VKIVYAGSVVAISLVGLALLLSNRASSYEPQERMIDNVSTSERGSKFALIIAIGKYSEESGWPEISSARDVPLILSALKAQGFREENISVLEDSAATKEGMVRAITNFTSTIREGDIVVVHFSGHGQQVEDDNGDEEDALDECLVPYDAPVTADSNYHGEQHLRDDQLGRLIEDMRIKAGQTGNVIATIDACYSGTITRGKAKTRGGAPPLVSGNFSRSNVKQDKGSGAFEKGSKSRGKDIGKAPFVLFSASSFDEPNFEAEDDSGRGVGSLSLGISKVLTNVDPSLTYRGVFDLLKTKIAAIMSKDQHQQTPQIEGDLDYKIFGGRAIQQKNYFVVDKIVNDTIVTLKGGTLYDIYDNSTIEFHPTGSADPKSSKAIVKGIVRHASALACDVVLEHSVKTEMLGSSWAFMTEQGFGNMNVKIQVRNVSSGIRQSVEKVLMPWTAIQLVDENPDVIIENNNVSVDRSPTLVVKTAGDGEVFGEPIPAGASDLAEQIKETVRQYNRNRLFRSLQSSSAEYNVTFGLVPVRVELSNGRAEVKDTLELSTKLTSGNAYEFKDGDFFKIRVHNIGTSVSFFSILDIQPDGIINVLVPDSNHVSSEYKIYPGETWELSAIASVGPPYGVEVLKLVATKDWLDFKTIINSRGGSRGTRGPVNPVEQLMQDSYSGTRGVKSMNLPMGAFSVNTFMFKIVPANAR
jgi:hypothetical protein